jgi:hypothetical protein
MKSGRLARRLPAFAGGAAIVAMGVLAVGCSSSEKPAETTTTTTTTSAPAPSPTEKGLNPTGGNQFSPTVLAPTPKTAVPGNQRNTGP